MCPEPALSSDADQDADCGDHPKEPVYDHGDQGADVNIDEDTVVGNVSADGDADLNKDGDADMDEHGDQDMHEEQDTDMYEEEDAEVGERSGVQLSGEDLNEDGGANVAHPELIPEEIVRSQGGSVGVDQHVKPPPSQGQSGCSTSLRS